MLDLSKRVFQIGDSPTLSINAKARALKAAGEPVIHLGGGEPILPAPQAAVEAIIQKAQSGQIKYTPSSGTPALKKAILAYTQAHYARTFAPENVIVSAGAKQALFNFLMAAVGEKEEVIIPAPYWVSYPEMVKLAGGTPHIVKPQSGLHITFDELARAVTEKTKVILLNSPCNPSGYIYPADFIEQTVKLAEQKNIFLVMDDIYHQLVYDGRKTPNPCAYASEHAQNLVLINGVSKLYGMTGLRIGWAVSNHTDLIKAMGKIQAQSTSCNSDISEVAATAALNGPQAYVENLRRTLEENRNILLEELSHIPHVKVERPQGTFYAFADFSHYTKNSNALAAFLLEKVLVAVVPGAAFGAEGFLRISFCASKNAIINGIRRMRWALDETTPPEIKIGDKLVTRN